MAINLDGRLRPVRSIGPKQAYWKMNEHATQRRFTLLALGS